MKKKLLPAYLLTLVNVLGFSILMPILPFVVADYGAPKWVYGLLLTLYSAFQFIGTSYLGALSDEKGRKPILLISQLGTLVSWLVFILALSLPNFPVLGFALPVWVIALSRILDGVTGGNTAVANAYVADITTHKEKSYIFGYLGVISGLGMIVGPGIGGFAATSSLGHLGTLLVATGISLVALLTIFFWLKESHSAENRVTQRHSTLVNGIFVFKRIRQANAQPVIRFLLLIRFLFAVMMAFYISTIALFLVDLFAFDEKQLGLFMLVVGLFLAFNQGVVSKRFIRKFGVAKTLLIGLALTTIGLFCIALTTNLYLYIAFYYIFNLGLSTCFPTFNALIALYAPDRQQGEIMGISESLHSLSMAVFPILATVIYGWIGFKVYLFIAAVPLVALLITTRRLVLFERDQQH